MAHECNDCGESFETLTRLRLHDCGDVQSDTTAARTGTSTSSPTRERNVSVAELDDLLDRVSDGDVNAIYRVVGMFESTLSSALVEDRSGATYRDVFWPYYERVSDKLDETARSEGWELLGDVVDAYDPTGDDDLPLVTPVIANAVGRYVIRLRLTDGVSAIPAAALEYLDAVAVNAAESADVAKEETHAYGWGINHPDHSVVDRLRVRASEDLFSVNPVLEHAFYADQHAAVDALEQLLRDESIDGTIPQFRREDMSHRRFLLDCVYGLKTDDYWPTTPRYWEWHEEVDYAFELDEMVERRIRDLVVETGIDDDLPDDWTFRDLGI